MTSVNLIEFIFLLARLGSTRNVHKPAISFPIPARECFARARKSSTRRRKFSRNCRLRSTWLRLWARDSKRLLCNALQGNSLLLPHPENCFKRWDFSGRNQKILFFLNQNFSILDEWKKTNLKEAQFGFVPPSNPTSTKREQLKCEQKIIAQLQRECWLRSQSRLTVEPKPLKLSNILSLQNCSTNRHMRVQLNDCFRRFRRDGILNKSN